MQRILLTGATGFLGSHLLESFINTGYEVVILKRSISDTWRINHLLNRVTAYDIDIQDIERAFSNKKIDVVVHTACSYGRNGESVYKVVKSNLIFGLQVLDACIKHEVGIFCNTDTLLNKEVNDYALSKNQFVEWLKRKSSQVQVINMKLEHMYGPKDDSTKFVSWLLEQMKVKVKKVSLTSGEQLRDFIYIEDVVSAYMTVLSKADELPEYCDFEVGTGESIPVKQFILALKKEYEKKFGLSQAQLDFGALPHRAGEEMIFRVNNSALKKLGWRPKYTLEEGLNKLVGDMK